MTRLDTNTNEYKANTIWQFKKNYTHMKILLEVNDSKAAFFLEILSSFKFVKKATPLSNTKAQNIQNMQDAISELNLIREGKLKGILAKDLLNDL
jgi:hypothetical protein